MDMEMKMSWTDMVKEGWRKAMESELGRELAQKARAKAEEGIDRVLGGQTAEGEKMIDEATRDAKTAAEENIKPPTEQ
jgi:hypothetical protein